MSSPSIKSLERQLDSWMSKKKDSSRKKNIYPEIRTKKTLIQKIQKIFQY